MDGAHEQDEEPIDYLLLDHPEQADIVENIALAARRADPGVEVPYPAAREGERVMESVSWRACDGERVMESV